MLLELQVHNVVIIEDACISIKPEAGFCVISGETGAGKSLLFDALALLQGERAAARLIGPADDYAQVTAVLQLSGAQQGFVEDEFGLSCDDGSLIIRRRLTNKGRSQAWVNDVPVALTLLRSLSERLIDIRAQHEHLRLADVAHQRTLLDASAGLQDLCRQHDEAHSRRQSLRKELHDLAHGEADSLKERDFTRFLLDELEALNPQEGGLQALEQEQELRAGAQQWRALSGEAVDLLQEGDRALLPQLADLQTRLAEAPEAHLQQAAEALATAQDVINEAAMDCVTALDVIEVDEEATLAVEERLAQWLDLQRKHGGTEAAMLQAWQDLQQRFDELNSLGAQREQLEAELAACEQDYAALRKRLCAKRRTAFKALSKAVHEELAELGMPRAHLSLVEHEADSAHVQEWYLCTNPGLEPGPVGTVASGGEAARLALALASVSARYDDTPLMVFDEVDSGVGGRLGLVIGHKLQALAQLPDGGRRSILAITHTPQIAALADQHYCVRKTHAEHTTAIVLQHLQGKHRIEEVSDMLGGGSAAYQQAENLLAVNEDARELEEV